MLKRRQEGRPKFPVFCQKSSKNASYHGLWSKMRLGSLQEPAKSLPGASQEASRGTQEQPSAISAAPTRRPSAFLRPLTPDTSHLTPATLHP